METIVVRVKNQPFHQRITAMRHSILELAAQLGREIKQNAIKQNSAEKLAQLYGATNNEK